MNKEWRWKIGLSLTVKRRIAQVFGYCAICNGMFKTHDEVGHLENEVRLFELRLKTQRERRRLIERVTELKP